MNGIPDQDPALKGLEVPKNATHRDMNALLRYHLPIGIKKATGSGISLKDNPKGSSTPGTSKMHNCQAGPRDRVIARRNRSYRDDDYANWLHRMRKLYG